MTPYYERGGIRIFHGDSREVLETIDERFGAIITDPVWPGATVQLAGSEDPEGLFRDVAYHATRLAERLVVHLGRDTDPRMLANIPDELPFLCVCWLRHIPPAIRRKRVLAVADVAYVYGAPTYRTLHLQNSVIPGEVEDAPTNVKSVETRAVGKIEHPCPRAIIHVSWLVRWFAGESVLDPFMGSGTTLLAAQKHGIPGVGIEIEERYCEVAAKRLAQGQLFAPGGVA